MSDMHIVLLALASATIIGTTVVYIVREVREQKEFQACWRRRL